MKVSTTDRDQVSIMITEGRIDSSNVSEFETPLNDLISKGKTKIVLDMTGVEYMASVGLRTIISAMKKLQEVDGSLKLAGLTNNVRGTLLVMGLDVFEIYDTVDQAVAGFA